MMAKGALLFFIWAVAAHADRLLVSVSEPSAPGLRSISTYAGMSEIRLSPVEASHDVTILLLVDTIPSSVYDRLGKELSAMNAELRNSGVVRFASLRRGYLTPAASFDSPAKLAAFLRDAATGAPSDLNRLDSTEFYAALLQSCRSLGSNWSHVLLIGELPPITPAAQEYAIARVARTFEDARLRLSYFGVLETGHDLWRPVIALLRGKIWSGSASEYTAFVHAQPSLIEVSWTAPRLVRGFHVYGAALMNSAGLTVLDCPSIAIAPSLELPELDRYAELRRAVDEVNSLLQLDHLDEAGGKQIVTDLNRAFLINPADADALRAGAAFYGKHAADHKTSSELIRTLLELKPSSAALYAELGKELSLIPDLAGAEQALLTARELGLKSPEAAEELLRVYLTRRNDAAAMPLIDEILRDTPKRQDLWFIRAATAKRLGRFDDAADSLEHGLESGGHLEERTELIRLYILQRRPENALTHIRKVLAEPPRDVKTRATYAAFLDQLEKPAEASSVWRLVLDLDPHNRPAHERITQLLLEKGDLAACVKSADDAFAAGIATPPIYLAKANALQLAGDTHAARTTLREGAGKSSDIALLSNLARIEELFPNSAAAAYRALSNALLSSGGASSDLSQSLRSGLQVALRDDDPKAAEWFWGQLQSRPSPPDFHSATLATRSGDGIWIPGGVKALAFIAGGSDQATAERFLQQYTRLIATLNHNLDSKNKNSQLSQIDRYFETVVALERLGTRKENHVYLNLSLANKDSRKTTAKVLDLLGIKMRKSNAGLTLEQGQKAAHAQRQETTSALAIDEVGMQETLNAGKTYTIDIPYEWVRVYPPERAWREALYPKENFPGGMAQAFVRLPRMAELYAGLSVLDRDTITEILSALDLKTLCDKHSGALLSSSSAFSVHKKRAVVPGGMAAEPVWTRLVGASPSNPASFLKALIEKGDGKMPAFFHAISQTDPAHQRFVTLTFSRLNQFYEMFLTTSEAQHAGGFVREAPFSSFLREIPLNPDGTVDFPGSPEVWMVAKGSSTNTAKMLKKVSKSVAPDKEDEILLRLAQTRYKSNFSSFSELDNFLAVYHIDAHRKEPLDEESALLLAQHYVDAGAVYPYFTTLTDLRAKDFKQFFALVDKLQTRAPVETNLVLAQLHSLIEILCLIKNQGSLEDKAITELFGALCQDFLAASSESDYSAASLNIVRKLLGFAKSERGDEDSRLRALILGPVDASAVRSREFARVLELQKIPRLASILRMDAYAANFATGEKIAEQASALEHTRSELPDPGAAKGFVKEVKAVGREKQDLSRYDLSAVDKRIAEIRQSAAKRKTNTKDLPKLAAEFRGAMMPQIALALAGIVYAYYLRPSDLIVAEDAWLIRKHRYFNFTSGLRRELLPASFFMTSSTGAGSYFQGGFARMSIAAGHAASAGSSGKGTEPEFVAAQLSACRAVNWNRLRASDLRSLSLRVLTGREWIVQAAVSAAAFQTLSDTAFGVLSLARRAELLNAVSAQEWNRVWDTVTLSDQFFFGSEYIRTQKQDLWHSPATAELRRIVATMPGSRLDTLGPVPSELQGCNHPHLMLFGPYEEYERLFMPGKLAERTAEWNLYAGWLADQLSASPTLTGTISERLALRALKSAVMTGLHDWRSLIRSYASIDQTIFAEALKQP